MAEDAESDEQTWRFSVDEVGPGDDERDPDGDLSLSKGDVPAELVEEADEDEGGNVAGTLTSVGSIEPETPNLENAAFVLLGVYIGILAIVTMIAPAFFGTIENVLVVVGGVLAVTLLSLGFFGVLTPGT